MNYTFLVFFSFFEKTTYCPSVRLSSVEFFLFGNWISNRPIECHLRGSASSKGVFFRNSNCKLQIYATEYFLQIHLCARFGLIY